MALKNFIIIFQAITLINSLEYRLPHSVLPFNYDITIRLETDSFTTEKFKGDLNITLYILNRTREIQIHSKSLTGINLHLQDSQKSYNLTNRSYVSDPITDILTITSEEDVAPGRYFLLATYDGRFDTHNMEGVYKSTYVDRESGKSENLATTQMGITHARRAFLCFDEPAMKATFNLTVVYPRGYNVLANAMQDGGIEQISNNLEKVRFKPTPPMATYVVAFIVSHFTCDDITIDNLTHSVCSRPESQPERSYPLSVTPPIVKILEDFTGIPYNSSGLSKISLAAIPDFYYSAMENWGLVTFKERDLLLSESRSSNGHHQRVLTLIAHELAHMWFGNLVTTEWWTDIFLNEGLATYFQYFAAAKLQPKWELDLQFVIEQVHTAFVADSDSSSLPLSWYVETQEEIAGRFNTISYNKGASVLRMIAHVMGPNNFYQGLRGYLEAHKFSNSAAKDLWTSLDNVTQLPYTIQEIAKNWTFRPGYPVLNVTANKTSVIITQECFFLSGQNSTKWYVPITYTTSGDTNQFHNTTPSHWLIPADNSITLSNVLATNSDWLVLNNIQTGYYRVNYDNNLWNRLESALRSNSSTIHVISKAQIVDDLFNFAQAGKIPYSKLLERINFLQNDTDYYPWYSALNGFSKLLPRIARNGTRQQLTGYISQLMNKLYRSAPFSTEDVTNQIHTLKQVLAITWACRLEHEDCIRNSKEIFSVYKSTGISPRRNLKLPVLCTSLRHSNNSEEDWNFLWEQYKSTNIANEQMVILSALTCTTNQTILKKLLEFVTDDEIRRQDASLVFNSIITGGPAGVNVTLQFLIDAYEKIFNYYKNENSVTSFIANVGSVITERGQIDKLSSLVRSGKLTESIKLGTEYTIAKANSILVENTKLENELLQYFSGTKNFASVVKCQKFYLIWAILALTYFTGNL